MLDLVSATDLAVAGWPRTVWRPGASFVRANQVYTEIELEEGKGVGDLERMQVMPQRQICIRSVLA